MSLLAESAAPAVDDLPEGVATISQVNWQQYLMFDAIFTERRGVRLSYLNGVLEIMAPIGKPHENKKRTLSMLLEIYLRARGIRFYATGSATLRKTGYSSIEPDESYCLGSEKEKPDLVIEVVFTSGSLDKLEIYRSLAIPEVWFWKKGKLTVYCLENRVYQARGHSVLLPDLNLALLETCANQPDQYDAVEDFRQHL